MLNRIKSNAGILVYVLVIFIAFPFFYFSSTLDPETLPRTVALSILLLFYLGTRLLNSNKLEADDLSFLKNPVIICFFLYALVSSFSLFKAINPGDGLFDVLKIWIYLGFLFLTSILLKEEKDNLLIIIKCINISVLIFTGFGLFQLSELYFSAIDFNTKFRIDYSLCSTLANKNIYSEVLLLSIPFAIYGIIALKGFWKYLCSINVFIILLSIIVLVNIYIWLALLLCFIFLALFLISHGRKTNMITNKLIRSAAIICISIFVAASVTFIKFSDVSHLKTKVSYVVGYFDHPEGIDRLDIDKDDNNIHERIVLARNTWRMIKESSFLGVGISNWKIFCPKYGAVSYTDHIRVDYPHNDYLSVLAEAGIFGILFYVLFFTLALRCALVIFYRSEKADDKWLGLLMFCGILGFVIISFFGFSKEKIFPMIFLTMMISITLSKYFELFNYKKDLSFKLKRIVLLFLIIISGFTIFVGSKRLNSEVHLAKAMKAHQLMLWPDVINEAEKAYSLFYPVDFSATPIYWYKGIANFYSDNIDSALVNFKRAEQLNPYHVEVLNDLATCYELQNDNKNAIYYYEKAFQLNPRLVRKNLVAVYFNSGAIEKAFELASSPKFGKPVFLPEILLAKAKKVCSLQKDDIFKEFLSNEIKKEDWLLMIFSTSKASNRSFEDVLITEAKNR